jgi:lipopolysaccharide transport system ATP-binding protein
MAPSIFHITHWKAGSQWVRAVLEDVAPDRIVQPLPDQRHDFNSPIVPGGIYTPVYASEQQFRAAVPVTINQRTFVVVRDPRDTLVSWYYSLRYSHGEDYAPVGPARRLLQEVDLVDGLTILLRGELADAVNIQMTWLQAGATMFRYEDLLADELAGFRRIMDFCQIEIDDDSLLRVVQRHSFERVSGRKRGQADPTSPLRLGASGDWRSHFPDRFISLFRTLFGEATVRLGYAPPGPVKW